MSTSKHRNPRSLIVNHAPEWRLRYSSTIFGTYKDLAGKYTVRGKVKVKGKVNHNLFRQAPKMYTSRQVAKLTPSKQAFLTKLLKYEMRSGGFWG